MYYSYSQKKTIQKISQKIVLSHQSVDNALSTKPKFNNSKKVCTILALYFPLVENSNESNIKINIGLYTVKIAPRFILIDVSLMIFLLLPLTFTLDV